MIDVKIIYPKKKIKYLEWSTRPDYGCNQAILIRTLPYLDPDIKNEILSIFLTLKTDTNQLGHIVMDILQTIISTPDNVITKPNVIFPSIQLSVEHHSNYNNYYECAFGNMYNCFNILSTPVDSSQLNCELVEIKVDLTVNTYNVNIVSLRNLILWLESNKYFFSKNYKHIAKYITKKLIRIEKHTRVYKDRFTIY